MGSGRTFTPGAGNPGFDKVGTKHGGGRCALFLTSKLLMSVEAPSHAQALASIRVLIVLEHTIRVGLMPTFQMWESARVEHEGCFFIFPVNLLPSSSSVYAGMPSHVKGPPTTLNVSKHARLVPLTKKIDLSGLVWSVQPNVEEVPWKFRGRDPSTTRKQVVLILAGGRANRGEIACI